jgi:putative ABC transporter, substrate-binding protein
LRAIKKGYEYAAKNPEESAKILVKNSPELDINLVTASQKWISKEYQADAKEWGIIDGNRWNGFYEWLYKNKAVEREIPKDFGYSNEYLK